MSPLWRNRTYRRLFAAQVVALTGTGLLTVALGLLAFDLAGDRAGAVLGAVYTIKMIAYVGLSPLAQAWVQRLPRRAVLIGADLIRAGVALCLPFVSEVWQIYVLIFALQSASATFTPAYQATLPDVLPDEDDYTQALSLSRLAYDLENLTSPALAGLLLSVLSYSNLFLGTVAGFLASALLILSVALPPVPAQSQARPFSERVTRGVRLYLATPRLRGLLSLTLAAAAAGAFVLVNTVVLVRSGYGRDETALAVAMAAFGAGSMTAALALPAVLRRLRDRTVMTASAAGLIAAMAVTAVSLGGALPGWPVFLLLWAGTGALYSAIQTPGGRLLRRSSGPEDRPALFAAQFALSHACWLVTYPLAGWAGAALGMSGALWVLTVLALAGLVSALRFWPRGLPAHRHADLPPGHPHLREHPLDEGGRHDHAILHDGLHRGL
ncbi:MFS transporter [Aestuariicoccus sp. MJ-SS9]|uniref:MFS transporter n=1 Tax=Aestuariicoccus sp. MJ-SS9 TaxID=3079855 RepID=UPI002913C05C|nr:MFS transporter [Aestuariicoccus sp. MJ-SS9]MDU8909927.1 MFS transporter [Aestuariicoccus sp. MJ-SS9]